MINELIGVLENASLEVNVTITETGPRGLQGEQGIQGEIGKTGPRGEQGIQGIQGPKGNDGYTPVKGVDYFDGEQGIQGPKGDKGDDGYTPIKDIDYFDGIDGKDGEQGPKGDKGEDGYTPIKGVDYFDGEQGPPGTTAWGGITDKPTNLETVEGSQDKANQAEQNAKDYTDQEISSIDIPDSTWESIQNKPDTFAPSEHVHSIGSVTGLQNELNSKETPSGAQAKANVAESNAKDYADEGLADKVDKVTGKQLSTEDYTSAEKTKLSGIATGANNYTHPANHPASMITGLPNSLPADGGNADTVGGFTVGTNVPADAVFTDTVYSHPTDAGNKHIPTGGATGQVLKCDFNGTAYWGTDTDTKTTINGKTGMIFKSDIVALGIQAQGTDLRIGNFKFVFNKVENSLDFEVLA